MVRLSARPDGQVIKILMNIQGYILFFISPKVLRQQRMHPPPPRISRLLGLPRPPPPLLEIFKISVNDLIFYALQNGKERIFKYPS